MIMENESSTIGLLCKVISNKLNKRLNCLFFFKSDDIIGFCLQMTEIIINTENDFYRCIAQETQNTVPYISANQNRYGMTIRLETKFTVCENIENNCHLSSIMC